MFLLCVESSHTRGMGHLFRVLNLAEALTRNHHSFLILINNHKPSIRLLEAAGHNYKVVELIDLDTDWEGDIISSYNIDVWINDRLNTDIKHSSKVKNRSIPLVTFDDCGSGAAIADINFASLVFGEDADVLGKRVFRGVQYLILNPEIDRFKRVRSELSNILVTMGGSDTYGVTIKVVDFLQSQKLAASVIVGPGFEHHKTLSKIVGHGITIKSAVPSLIKEFNQYDLAITGGGVTPFEANASGLPCLVIANEYFEKPVAAKLQELGGSIFIGHHEEINFSVSLQDLPLRRMSKAGMKNITTEGVDHVVNELLNL